MPRITDLSDAYLHTGNARSVLLAQVAKIVSGLIAATAPNLAGAAGDGCRVVLVEAGSGARGPMSSR